MDHRSATLVGPRIGAIRRFLAGDARGVADPFLDRFCDLVAATFHVEIALITIVDDRFARTYGSHGAAPFEMPREETLAATVVDATGDEVLVVPDLARYGDATAAATVRAMGGRFFAGAPLVSVAGERIGALTLIDSRPRRLYAAVRERLSSFAAFAMELVAARLEAIEVGSQLEDHRSTVLHAPSAIVSVGTDGSIVAWNAAAERLYGWTFDEVAGKKMPGIPAERREFAETMLQELLTTGEAIESRPTVCLDRAGRPHDIVYSAAINRDGFGRVVGATFITQDVSRDRLRAQLENRRSEILELAATDAELDRILDRLAAYVEFAIADAHVALLVREERGGTIFFVGDHPPAAVAPLADAVRAAGAPFPLRFLCNGAFALDEIGAIDGHVEVHEALRRLGLDAGYSHAIADSRGTSLGAIVVHHTGHRALVDDEIRAIGEAAALAALAMESDAGRVRLERLALHDALTGLPNRALLEQRLALTHARAAARGSGFAVAMLDLDRFKLVNDSFGHAAGDQLLVEVGNRIRASLRSSDFVARLAGDEFLIVIEDATDRATATRVVRKVVDALGPAFTPGGHELFVRASVGIAMYPDDAAEAGELLRRVDGAMYAAKSGGSTIGFVDPGHDRGSALEVETDLNRAIAGGELELHYQPCVDVETGDLRCSEALLRWRHPRHGMLSPDRFIPIAEESGMIVPIGAWVLGEACAFARRWRDAGGRGVVTVNVSARQFEDRGFVATVIDAVLSNAIEPTQLWLEITETLIMRSPESAAATLAELRRFGVRSAIDDFGTGYSSLAYLKRFPIDGIKIDRAFVKDLGAPEGRDDGDRAIVESIVALGRALGLAIVAEGAETAEQIDILCRLGCAKIQGYFIARPMPEAAMLAWRVPARAGEGERLELVV